MQDLFVSVFLTISRYTLTEINYLLNSDDDISLYEVEFA